MKHHLFYFLFMAMCVLVCCTTENVPVLNTDVIETDNGTEHNGKSGLEGKVFEITLSSEDADYNGCWSIYLKYNDGYYMDAACNRPLYVGYNSIVCPERSGYNFLGYNTRADGSGQMMIDSNGVLSSSLTATSFTADTTFYAQWAENGSTDPTDPTDPSGNQTIDGAEYSGDGKTLLRYYNDESVTEYVIPDGVTTIGRQAFTFNKGLKTLTIPASVTEFQWDAFYMCELEKVIYKGTVEQWCQIDIEDWGNPLEYGHNLYINDELVTELVVPDTVTEIKDFAFEGGSFQKVTLPDTITSIGNCAFRGCTNLTEINLPDSISYIGWYGFENCTALEGVLTLPASLAKIEYNSFTRCSSLTSIVIPASVKEIDNEAFTYCTGMKSLVIPETVELISESILHGCSGLEDLTVPYIGATIDATDDSLGYFFYGREYPNSVKISTNLLINNITWYYYPRSLRSLTILGGTIGLWACEKTLLTDVTLGDNVVYVGGDSFENCNNLARVHCSSITNWCRIKFGDSNNKNPLISPTVPLYINGEPVTSVTFPDDITIINDGAFAGYNLTGTLTIPDSVTYIGEYAFYYNRELTGTFSLPANLTYLGEYAFFGDEGFTCDSIVIPNGIANLNGLPPLHYNNVTFGDGVKNIDFWTSDRIDYTGSIADWCGITWGRKYHDNTILLELSGSSNVYVNGAKVIDLVIPEGVKEIKDKAFYKWDSIESVTLPSTLERIGVSAFEDCENLKGTLTIPGSVRNIGRDAFFDCLNLSSLVIEGGESLDIEYEAFWVCLSLKNLTLGARSIINIGERSFGVMTGDLGKVCFENIYYTGTLEQWCHQFNNVDDSCLVPKSGFREWETNLYIGGELVTDIVIPDTITEINSQAFCGITSIKSVTIPASVKRIGREAFFVSSISELTIADGDEISIGINAFAGCYDMTKVTLGSSITSIESGVFNSCANMTSILLKGDLSVDADASMLFYGCDKLESFYTPDIFMHLNESYSGIYTIPDGIKVISGSAFRYCSGLTGITIPDSVTTIGDYAFSNSGLASVTIPDSVTTIGDYAFSNSGLTSVTIPDSVTSIGQEAFRNCEELESVTIGNGVTSIGENTFADCSKLSNVTIGNGVKSIGEWAFGHCYSLESIVIPDSVTSIDSDVFSSNPILTSVIMPDGVSFVGAYSPFRYCPSLDSVYSQHTLYYFNPDYTGAFIIPDGIENVNISCSGLTSITIPDSVKNLNLSCCESLTSITIPNGVESVDLLWCSSLTNVIIPDSVTSIGSQAFAACSSLKSVTIGSGVTSIEQKAFAGCGELERITIGSGVTSIGSQAFYGCGKLTRVDYAGTIETWCGISFKDYYSCPFPNDYSLYIDGALVTDLVIPDTVTAINWRAFSGCTSLTSVTIPARDIVTDIGDFAFKGCTGLTSVTIIEGVARIGDNAFADCTGLTTVTVRCPYYPSLRKNVFENCSSLTAIYVPADALESYKTYGWSDYVDLIMPIEE